MNDALITVATSLITGFVSYMAGSNKNKTDFKVAKSNYESQVEQMYASNMSVILAEYKEQVSGFRHELDAVRKEFAEFKEFHSIEMAKNRDHVAYLEREIEIRDDRIEELEIIIMEKDKINNQLKGGNKHARNHE